MAAIALPITSDPVPAHRPIVGSAAASEHTMEVRNPISNPDADDSVEEDGPARKRARVRVSKACESCRKRKERCDGARPRCQRCSRLDLTCSYHQGRKRGLRTGYVRGLEILLGLVLNSYPESESLIFSVIDSDGQGPRPLDHVDLERPCVPHSSSLLESWRSSAVSDALQRTLMAWDGDGDEESRLRDLDAKITSIFNTRIGLNQHDQETHPSAGPPQQSFTNAQRASSSPAVSITQSSGGPITLPDVAGAKSPAAPSYHAPPVAPTSSPLEDPLPANWPRLIDRYIASTHCWLPIVEKYTFFRSASILASDHPSQDPSGRRLGSGEIASLWAALAYGSSAAGQLTQRDSHTQALTPTYTAALRLATQHCDAYEMGHVHALLILSLTDLAQKRWISAWILIGRAVYIAATLGVVPFGNAHTGRPPSEPEKRLFRGCFILDTLMSSRLGFRPYLNSTDMHSVGDISVGGMEEWEPWIPPPTTVAAAQMSTGPSKALSSFNVLGYLASLLNESNETVSKTENTQSAGRQILERYFRSENQILALDPATCLQDAESNVLFLGPPHIIQLRFVAASVYGILRNRVLNAGHQSFTELPEPRSPNVVKALRLLQSKGSLSDLLKSFNVPTTLQVFAHLFEKSQTQTPDESNLQWHQAAQSRVFVGANGLGQDDPVNPSLFAPPSVSTQSIMPPSIGLSEPPGSQTRSPIPNKYQGPLSTPTDQNISYDMAGSHSLRTMPLQHGSQPGEIRLSNTTGPSPGNTTPVRNQETGVDINSELPTDSSVFDQLSVLDTFEWSDFSKDFMERLGYSPNGDVMDFQSLITFE